MRRKKVIVSLTAVFAVILFLGIFIFMWYLGDGYPDFRKFKQEFEIDGLPDGAVPQGITSYTGTYTELDEDGKSINRDQQYFLTSAYMNDGSPSRIYVRGETTGYGGYVTMLNIDGTPHYGHVGGIATNGAKLWVGYGDSVLVAVASKQYEDDKKNILQEIVDKAAKNKDIENGEYVPEETEGEEGEAPAEQDIFSISFTSKFKANCNAAFLYYFDDPSYDGSSFDRLYVGEFYRKGNYETAENHRMETPNGYKNTALMFEYNVDSSSSNPYGLTRIDSTLKDPTFAEGDNVPKIQKIFSIPELVQGIAFSGRASYSSTEGFLVLSTSYGLANSHLLCFEWGKVIASSNRTLYTKIFDYSFEYKDVYRTVGGKKTPYTDSGLYVYYVDKSNAELFVNDYSIPSMSEGMCVTTPKGAYNNPSMRVYVLFESGSKKYNAFTRMSVNHVYSFIPKTK